MKAKRVLPVSGFVALIVAWFFIAELGLVNSLYLPRFETVIENILIFFANGGIMDLAATLYRVMVSFMIAAFLGIIVGLILGTYRKVYGFLEILIDFFRSIPSIAFYPLFLLILGIGDLSKIGLAAFVSFWIILINTIYGVWNSSKTRVKVAKVFKCTDWQVFARVIFFEALPNIFSGLKTAISVTLVMVVITEMFLGTRYGLGVKIFDSYASYKTADLYAQVLIIGLVGYILSKSFVILERKLIHWL